VRSNPVAWALTALGLLAVVGLPFLNVAPNRLVSGQGIALWSVLSDLEWSVWAPGAALLLALGGMARAKPSRWGRGCQVLLACALLVGLLALAGAYAEQVAHTQSPWARTSLGGAFWLLALVLWLFIMDVLHRLQAGPTARAALLLGVGAAMAGVIVSGGCDQLSLMKEYANRSELFSASVVRHLQIVALTMLPTLVLGLPLGWAVNRYAKLRQGLLQPLNIIQTIPSIALFGLLMVPLTWLAGAWPALATWGVSGIGLAPAVVALSLYSLLPVVRGTHAGLAQVPVAVLDAARGMGMGAAAIFWRAELPLATPVILAGVRTACIQAVGLAAVAALIGAGGLGAIMFDGLFSSAQDLVLLGVLPIMGLALLLDMAFSALTELASSRLKVTQA
jgi:osmoprotectant transport system permease protein